MVFNLFQIAETHEHHLKEPKQYKICNTIFSFIREPDKQLAEPGVKNTGSEHKQETKFMLLLTNYIVALQIEPELKHFFHQICN